MAFVDSGTFIFTTITAAKFNPYECFLKRESNWQDTTGSNDSNPTWTQGGLTQYSGRVVGWVLSGGPVYAQLTDTATIVMTGGQAITSDTNGCVLDLDTQISYRSNNKKLVVAVYNFKFSGAVDISIP